MSIFVFVLKAWHVSLGVFLSANEREGNLLRILRVLVLFELFSSMLTTLTLQFKICPVGPFKRSLNSLLTQIR
jgi:hypothetical protein